jgi:hypothetical protein
MLEAIGGLSKQIETGDVFAAKLLVEMVNYASQRLRSFACSPCTPAQAAIEEAARQMDHWPVSMPAMFELRERAKLDAMPKMLGDSLPEKMAPKSGSGGPRTCHKEDTSSGFARQILEIIRSAFPFDNEEKFEAAARVNLVAGVDCATIFAEGQAWQSEYKMIRAQGRGFSDERRAEAVSRFQEVWRAAGELPPMSKETASQWATVCIQWADARCAGCWEDYPWPPGIIKRAPKKAGKEWKSPRGYKVAVGEWIRQGITSLTGFACPAPPRQSKPGSKRLRIISPTCEN